MEMFKVPAAARNRLESEHGLVRSAPRAGRGRKRGRTALVENPESPGNPRRHWWAPRESNPAPTDYEAVFSAFPQQPRAARSDVDDPFFRL